ncbi:hypothetical protein ACFWUW_30220 [Streptomyces sp. NPDC058655]|uniref:hypothetical protein n=1 Tax=unclassified Streptomyces TaxID=2593676 RepID=UPI003665265A
MNAFLLASVAMVAIVALLTGYAIKKLSSTPARIVAVIVAITFLVPTFPPLFSALRPDAGAPGTRTPAPPTPGVPAPAPASPAAPTPASPAGAATPPPAQEIAGSR